MARAQKAVSTHVNGGSKSIALVDQELSNEVANIKDQISAPSGNKIKVEPRGAFVLPGGSDLGDEIQVVVVDFINRNFFYSQKFVQGQMSAPDCYALGKEIAKLAPEGDSPSAQNGDCRTCPLNVFGSGDNGKGKACQNRYWLSVLLVDPDNPEAHNDPDAPLYLLDLSPTNRKSFESVVAGIARSLNGPPIKAILTVTVRNAGTYATVSFSDPLPNPNYARHAARRPESMDALTRKPDFAAIEAKASAPRGRAATPARRTAAAARR